MDDQSQRRTARPFADALAESLGESLTHKLGSPWALKCMDEAAAAKRPEAAVHYRLRAAGGLQGECFVVLDQAQAAGLGSQLLQQDAAAFNEQQGEALAEVIVAAMEGLRAALAAQFGGVTFQVDRVEDVRLEEMLFVSLAASGGDEVDSPVLLYFNDALLTSLSSSNAGKPSAKAKKGAIDPTNLQLVMDVELNVSLRFGQCQLPLRDVLDLASGSVIELDRDVDDPVELLLDGKVIARGEAVIVDGNYGLRVTEIPEPIASHFVR